MATWEDQESARHDYESKVDPGEHAYVKRELEPETASEPPPLPPPLPLDEIEDYVGPVIEGFEVAVEPGGTLSMRSGGRVLSLSGSDLEVAPSFTMTFRYMGEAFDRVAPSFERFVSNGTLQPVPGNRFSTQSVFVAPTGEIRFAYGVEHWSKFNEARKEFGIQTPQPLPAPGFVPIGWVIGRPNFNWQNAYHIRVIPASRFGFR